MESGKYTSLEHVKSLDLVSYLASLGIQPSYIRGNLFWYNSPLRSEKTPSFKIDRRSNLWIDYGLRKSNGKFSGGTIIDFAIQYFDCTIGELLSSFGNPSFFHLQRHEEIQLLSEQSAPKITVISERSLWASPLLVYLKFRRISIPKAEQFCREIHYQIWQRNYYGIGFRNNSGGFEIRNSFAKLSTSPKDITILDNCADEVIVFEGYMDFLSFLTLHPEGIEKQFDFVVLNGVTLFERARSFMERHNSVRLYLDRDKAGRECTTYALSISEQYSDESHLYKNGKDLNHWLMTFGASAP